MIVVYHPSKALLTTSETKTSTDVGVLGGEQRAQPGHYFACRQCGACGPIRTGPDSRTRAVLDAHGHTHHDRSRKNEWRKQAGRWIVSGYGRGYWRNDLAPANLNVLIRVCVDRWRMLQCPK